MTDIRWCNDPSVDEILGEYVKEAVERGSWRAATLNRIRDFIYQDDPAGFRVFYEIIRNMPLPPHTYAWIDGVYRSRLEGRRFGVCAFRGSTKTTTLTETFTAYRIALEPHKSNLFVQAGDDQAAKHAKNVADIIESNPMWRILFPNIVPDKRKGWSENGYWVRDADVSYGEWTRRRAKDPTLLGAGYKAQIVVGSHPTGVFMIDDINNAVNTESARRSEEVNNIVKGTLFPMIVPGETWPLFNQTPWTERDALAYVRSTGTYDFVETPAFTFVDGPDPDDPAVVFYERFDSWVKLTWPEKFDIPALEIAFNESGPVDFARMYLLDLSQTAGQVLKAEWLITFPHDEIDPTWPDFMGVDYASTSDLIRFKERDYCVIVWGKVTPQRRLIVVDGIREHLTQQEAYQALIATAARMHNLQQVGVEAIGKGEEFAELLRMSDIYLPLMPIRSHSGLARTKGGRFERVLAPAFQRGDILLSDRQTPFLKAFRDEWLMWDGTGKFTDDCLDAVYMMVKAAEGWVYAPVLASDEIAPVDRARAHHQPNPFSGIRDHHG